MKSGKCAQNHVLHSGALRCRTCLFDILLLPKMNRASESAASENWIITILQTIKSTCFVNKHLQYMKQTEINEISNIVNMILNKKVNNEKYQITRKLTSAFLEHLDLSFFSSFLSLHHHQNHFHYQQGDYNFPFHTHVVSYPSH